MIRTIIDYIKDLFDPSPIKYNRFTLTKEQYEEDDKYADAYVYNTNINV